MALVLGFDVVGAQQISAHIAPGNTGSIAVATKLGMWLDTARSVPETNVYVLTADEFN